MSKQSNSVRKNHRIKVLKGYFKGCEGQVLFVKNKVCHVKLDWCVNTLSFHKDYLGVIKKRNK